MSFMNNLENLILDRLFNAGAWTPEDPMFLALSTTDPNKDGTNFTEATGAGYARVSVGNADWGAAATGALDNVNALTFPQATGDWSGGANMVAFGFFSASSGGTLRMADTLDVDKPVLNGDTAEFAIGDLDVQFVQTL